MYGQILPDLQKKRDVGCQKKETEREIQSDDKEKEKTKPSMGFDSKRN